MFGNNVEEYRSTTQIYMLPAPCTTQIRTSQSITLTRIVGQTNLQNLLLDLYLR